MGEITLEDDVFPDHLNEVEVHFRNGDTMKVDSVVRLQGADWLTAAIVKPHQDPSEEGQIFRESVILHEDDIRAIQSRYVRSPSDPDVRREWRVHCSDQSDASEFTQFGWEGQFQLHPDDDPTTHPMSEEERWPPREQDDSDPQQAQNTRNSDF